MGPPSQLVCPFTWVGWMFGWLVGVFVRFFILSWRIVGFSNLGWSVGRLVGWCVCGRVFKMCGGGAHTLVAGWQAEGQHAGVLG